MTEPGRDGAAGEGRQLSISLPLPPKPLHPNSATPNGFVRSRLRKTARELAFYAAYEQWQVHMRTPTLFGPDPPLWGTVKAHATFSGVRRDSDRDNSEAWLKCYRDGIADCVMEGANDHRWEWDEPEYVSGPRGVTITVREA